MKNNTQNELLTQLFMGVLGFILMISLGSCATNSITQCDQYLGLDKDKCMEDYRIREASYRRMNTFDRR